MADQLPQQIELPPAAAGYIQGLREQITMLSDVAAQHSGEVMALRVQLAQERKAREAVEKALLEASSGAATES